MSSKKPRVNKSKTQLVEDIQKKQKTDRERTLVKLMFPLVEGQDSIYDAQTAVAALSGFIKADVDRRAAELLVQDLKIDLSKEKDSKIKTAVLELLGLLGPEKARDVANLLERFGNTLAQYSAHEYMKQSMKEISLDKILA